MSAAIAVSYFSQPSQMYTPFATTSKVRWGSAVAVVVADLDVSAVFLATWGCMERRRLAVSRCPARGVG